MGRNYCVRSSHFDILQGMNILRFQERHQNNNNIDNNETPKSGPSLKNSLKIKN